MNTDETIENSLSKRYRLPSHLLWSLKQSFDAIPLISIARLIGFIISQSTGLLNAFTIGLLIDWVVRTLESELTPDYFVPLSIFAFYVTIKGIGGIMQNIGENMSGFQMEYVVPTKLLQEKLHQLPIASLENPKVQDAVNRYHENSYVIDNVYRKTLLIIGMLVSLAISIIPLFLLMPAITLALIAVAVPDILLNKRFIDLLWNLQKEQTVISRKGHGISNTLTSPEQLKEIEITGAFSYLQKYFIDYVDKYFHSKYRIYKSWAFSDFVTLLIYIGVMLLAVDSTLRLALMGEISLGDITFYITATMSIGGTLGSLAANSADVLGNTLKLNEIRAILDLPEPEIKSNFENTQFNPPEIKLKSVNFTYPNSSKQVLKDINLEIAAGEKVAIVGENGAGKTTLIKLLSRIYPVGSGEIMVNGQDINAMSEQEWFKQIGVLYQDFNMYQDLSAIENIVVGDVDKLGDNYQHLSLDEIQKELKGNKVLQQQAKNAAKLSDAQEFIEEYDNKYFEILSEKYENGTRPSSGQWQKIAIARFFFRNAPLLILDEPTSAIDALAEANIFDRIYKFVEDKTVIIVSHRFSTVRNADRIIVLEQGRIVEEGTHDELLNNKALYYKMFTTQAVGYK